MKGISTLAMVHASVLLFLFLFFLPSFSLFLAFFSLFFDRCSSEPYQLI